MSSVGKGVALEREGRVLRIPLDDIRRFEEQPRTDFDPDELQELARSLRQLGQINPALVREVDDDGPQRYELIEGERRWRAARIAGIPFLRCEILDVKDGDQQFAMSFVANLHHVGHSPLEMAFAIQRLRKTHEIPEIANLTGKSEGWVSMYLRLLHLDPRLQRLLGPETPKNERLKLFVALALARLHPSLQMEAYRQAGGVEANQRSAETIVRRFLRTEPEAKHPQARLRERKPADDYRNLVRLLSGTIDAARSFEEVDVGGLFDSRPTAARTHVRELVNELVVSLRSIRNKIPSK